MKNISLIFAYAGKVRRSENMTVEQAIERAGVAIALGIKSIVVAGPFGVATSDAESIIKILQALEQSGDWD